MVSLTLQEVHAMDVSQYMQKAKSLIRSVEGKSLSIEERREAAIELAGYMLNEARRTQTNQERRIQLQLDHMMDDPVGKVFTTCMTDQCFRSNNSNRVADQLLYTIDKYGVPQYLSYTKQMKIQSFKWIGKSMASVLVPLTKRMVRKETETVILPGEKGKLFQHIQKRRKEGVRINLNHLGEAILGENEAERRLQIYLDDLSRPEVEYISVKISTICSQIHLLAWEKTLEILIPRLKALYRTAMKHEFVRADGKRVPKFVNLDMEEYRDLHLTVDLFRRVLDDPEFYHYSAGIVLQSYLPDSYLIQQELTVWAMQRVANGGAPIKIRIVKGANLAMEQVESSMRRWPQAPYTSKADVDANYKRMINYGCVPEHAKAAHLGIASHNLFDIAYVMLLRKETGGEDWIGFEMLEGMAEHIRRVVQSLSGEMVLYCPAASQADFQNAVAYLIRRLDENTAPQNFLRHLFGLIPGTKEWQNQANHFSLSCHSANAVGVSPRRTQNRFNEPEEIKGDIFENEADTDWSLPHNCKWIQGVIREWSEKKFDSIPLVIGGKEIAPGENHGTGKDPSVPGKELYTFALASLEDAEKALVTAEKAKQNWGKTSIAERSHLLAKVAKGMRQKRGELIAAMVADAGKTVSEADIEVSEAIDFLEYYRHSIESFATLEDLEFQPKGTVMVTPPWNFSCAIPTGGIASALAAGNCVLFKPARETAYVGWTLAKIFWEAGIDREVLQFIICKADPVGSMLVKDPRVSSIILTGSTDTARLMHQLRPGIDLMAETGGKNALIVSAISDRDLAIKNIIQSAFGHAGQKCSACSLAILEAEVYDDPHFLEQLKDAAASLKVGSSWDFGTEVNPMILPPGETLKRGLTTLEKGEHWLLEPKEDPNNPNLWSPGIKLGVQEGGYTHQTEFFGPLLGLMRADNLEHAIRIANGTRYGLTSGLHSLDDREHELWFEKIEAGNCYINRGITGAIVQRQPFGGTKDSSFGPGAKAGGPNYVAQLMKIRQVDQPKLRELVGGPMNLMTLDLKKRGIEQEQLDLWNASIESYQYWWNQYFTKSHDPSLILGQDNYLSYRPKRKMLLRVQRDDQPIDLMRVVAAVAITGTPLEISGSPEVLESYLNSEWLSVLSHLSFVQEMESQCIERIAREEIRDVRLLSEASEGFEKALSSAGCNAIRGEVLANGRIELLRYLREVSLSVDYHRYGNLGVREGEVRKMGDSR